ncbi:MAG: valine dehydrogenase [Actinomycetota bacterium]|jgi:leucine dehydrogenase|nr:valine dehydrogenase [Actinomycetota bacterium]
MDVLDRISVDDFEQVVFCQDRRSGLRAIVAVHSTRLGPALGGTRFYPYPSEGAGLEDVLRLARGMTYKAAAAGLDLGGGKAVIFGDPVTDKTEALLRAYGRHVDALGGRYITAEDVGTTQADMDLILRETRFVTGVSQELGGSGDPSAATAYGVLWAMKAVARRLWDQPDSVGQPGLEGRHVVVAGVGKVGTNLVRHLVEERAHVTVADVNPAAVARVVSEYGVEAVPVEGVHAVACDIFSPCAMGGGLDASTIPELGCLAVVGAANNQLADPGCAELLDKTGVLYAPDYVVNAGGVINIAEELAPRGYNRVRAFEAVRRVFDNVSAVLTAAEAEGSTTAAAADSLAERRIEAIGHVHQLRVNG